MLVSTMDLIDQLNDGIPYTYHQIIEITELNVTCFGQYFMVLNDVMLDLNEHSPYRYESIYSQLYKSFVDIDTRKAITPILQVRSNLNYYIQLYVDGE